MLQIPLKAVPNQFVSVALAGQNCQIKVAQKDGGVYLTLYKDNVLIIGGVICENKNRIVKDAYFDFVGDLSFYDLQGNDDPSYEGFGSRFLLLYLEVADLAAA